MSDASAWSRLACKHSPSKSIHYSPIKPAIHMLPSKGLFKEDIIRAQIWALLNTEEFYYQNTASMVYFNMGNNEMLARAFNDHRNVIEWSTRLKNYTMIGSGGFGEIFKATDKITGQLYALKIINQPNETNLTKLFHFVSLLFRERNLFAELNKSIFFVRMLGAFQSSDMSQFIIVMDFCLCTVLDLLRIYPYYDHVKLTTKDYFVGNSFKKVSEIMTEKLSMDFERLSFIYLFEMLCGLHYLASRHIVHADIKPENILIAKNGHIKFSDFGLSFKTEWFFRRSADLLPANEKELQSNDEIDQIRGNVGSDLYFDPEMKIGFILRKQMQYISLLKIKLKNSEFYPKLKSFDQNFLSDLYAIGLVAMELLTGGVLLSEETVLPSAKTTFWTIESVYRKELNDIVYQSPIMKMSKCNKIKSVLYFIASIFLPREIRSKQYRTEIQKYRHMKVVSEFCIDISSIENLLFYQSMSMTKENVGNFIFPTSYLELLLKNREDNSDIKAKETAEKCKNFNLHPFSYGCTLSD